MNDPVDILLKFLKDLYPNGPFKSFYDSDPDLIPLANLPALVVDFQDDDNDNANSPTGLDRVSVELIIKVVMNKRDDYDTQNEGDLTARKIRKLVNERDPVTGAYLPQTIKGALRANLTLGGFAISNDMKFQLGMLPRPNDMITSEGHLIISLDYFVPAANRS